uniref:Pre-mRNA-splicing factor 18 n=1 Tax=Romanomermis culicivorax TaxID=13658 RepID=A0A915KL12_ROMCU
MDIIKKEIERKRKQIEETNLLITQLQHPPFGHYLLISQWREGRKSQCANANFKVKDKKFFRRGDLEAYQREQYWKIYNEKHAKKFSAPSTSIIDQFRSVEENSNLPENGGSLQPQLSPEEVLSSCVYVLLVFTCRSFQVIRKLRDRNAPIRLFGENDFDAFKRLRTLEVDLPDVETGFRNDLQAAMDQVDEDFLKEIIAGQDADKRHDAVVEDETITFNELQFILQKWGRELNSRPMDEKRSSTGKFALATYTQTREYLNPLFKKLKTKMCLPDIREHLVNITLCLLKRDYIQANNCYMEMAIGNAPWPVGVTASGIHKRPGSEKLYVRNVAHVLNDELQRKYIQKTMDHELNESELGTKKYWDNIYEMERKNFEGHGDIGEIWVKLFKNSNASKNCQVRRYNSAELRAFGDSMYPLIKNDQVILALPVIPNNVNRGDVVICRDPSKPNEYLVKRITAISGDIVRDKK